MYISKIGRGALILAIVTAYSATVYTFSGDSEILQDQPGLNATQVVYSHTPEDISKIRAALSHEVSGVRAASVVPGAECVVYRSDVHSDGFHAEVSECLEPNLPIELAR